MKFVLIKAYLRLERLVRKNWGLIWRGLLCSALGLLFLLSDEGSHFDTRFQLRGEKSINSQIVLLTIRANEIHKLIAHPKVFPEMNEVVEVTDSYFWDQQLWFDLLKTLLAQNPKKIGVTFFFNQYLKQESFHVEEQKVFQDSRVIWSSGTGAAEGGGTQLPLFASYNHHNIGGTDLIRDQDGVIRLFAPFKNEVPHLVEELSSKQLTGPLQINFKGGIDSYPTYQLSDVLEKKINMHIFEGKIILIGPESVSSTQYLTPFGPQNRTAVLAQILDNALENSWIRQAPLWLYQLLFLALELLCIFLITQYPHSIAFVFLTWVATLIAALSAWVFDSFFIWLPVLSPLLLILTTWIIFIGHQANKVEQRNSLMKQEQEAMQKLEQLKNNFVSLISHDLKTPIAKISAVVDRLRASNTDPDTQSDLIRLGEYSEELNRYIQSILKVLRVESREFRLQISVDDINANIESVIEQVKPLAQQKNLLLQSNLEPLFSIEADFILIREVILNLIENAIKYSFDGGQVLVTSTEVDNWVIVTVIDNGPGIAAEEAPLIWGKFTRGKDQDLRTKGSGLGLYLVKYFVELHGGQVGLESSPGKGCKVFFKLPIETIESSSQENNT